MNTDELNLLDTYLQNEDKRYEDWYREVILPNSNPNVEPVAVFPSIQNLKQQFEIWYQHRQILIQYQVCMVWKYNEKRELFDNTKMLITAGLVDALAVSLNLPTTNLIMVAAILVTDGFLDKLCEDSLSNDNE